MRQLLIDKVEALTADAAADEQLALASWFYFVWPVYPSKAFVGHLRQLRQDF